MTPWLAAAVAITVAVWPSQSAAAAHRGKSGRARTAQKSTAGSRPAAHVGGKVVVFPFRDDDDRSMSAQIERLLRARGFEIVTGVRPVDTAEQYRELASTLNLAALIGGSYDEGEKSARLTIQVRSGYTGRRLIAATFKESRLHLRGEIEDRLWNRIGPAMQRASADAARPRRRGRGPLVIDAGTELATSDTTAVP